MITSVKTSILSLKTGKTFLALGASILLSACSSNAQKPAGDCLAESTLRERDANYEKALVEDDVDYLDELLHPNFNWVHNHASYIEPSKAAIINPMRERIADDKPAYSVKREQSGVVYLRAGETAVLHGFTNVYRDKSKLTGDDAEYSRYHFMRTYSRDTSSNSCVLLANHTMEIPKA